MLRPAQPVGSTSFVWGPQQSQLRRVARVKPRRRHNRHGQSWRLNPIADGPTQAATAVRRFTPACPAGTAVIDKLGSTGTIATMQVTPFRSWLPFSCLAFSAVSACGTPLAVQADADRDIGRPDALSAAVPDVVPDVVPDAVPDAPQAFKDLGGSEDERPRGGTPKGFRFDNQTEHTVYITRALPVTCSQQSAAGLVDCNFFPFPCGMSCSAVSDPQSCCTLCIGSASSLYVIAPGKSQFVAWSGTTHAKASNLCTDCPCNQESPASTGTVFQASIAVYTEYSCDSAPCVASDAGVMEVAWAAGTPTTYTVNFSLPYLGDEVVFVIPGRPGFDAAVPDAIALDAPADPTDPIDAAEIPLPVDASSGVLPVPFAGVPGGSFVIAAELTPLDASLDSGRACLPLAPESAHYSVVFSADGATVKISYTDSGKERVYLGELTMATNDHLSYAIKNASGNPGLTVWLTDGVLTAQFFFVPYSGTAPGYCAQSPMARV